MALIIETGLGVASADSYITEADAQTLAADYDITLPAVVADSEKALRRAYLLINNHERLLQGWRTHSVQTGAFPRLEVYANDFLVGSEVIPQDVKLAQLYAASAISSGVDTNAVDTGQDVKSCEVVGVFKEEYQDGARVKVNSRIQGVYNSLYPYYKSAIAGQRSYRDHEDVY